MTLPRKPLALAGRGPARDAHLPITRTRLRLGLALLREKRCIDGGAKLLDFSANQTGAASCAPKNSVSASPSVGSRTRG